MDKIKETAEDINKCCEEQYPQCLDPFCTHRGYCKIRHARKKQYGVFG